MRVLVACEFSGVVRDAFRHGGHEAWSSDLEGVEPEGYWSNYHLFGDCRLWLDGSAGPCRQWDLLIAHPPCTYLCNSGVRWVWRGGHRDGGRDYDRLKQAFEAAKLFADLWQAPIPRIAIENPVMHGYGQSYICQHLRGRGMAMLRERFRPSQIIQPWQFGEPETKATCLWLKGLPPLAYTEIMTERTARVHRMAPGPNRGKDRSRSYVGIAEAMAGQWSGEP